MPIANHLILIFYLRRLFCMGEKIFDTYDFSIETILLYSKVSEVGQSRVQSQQLISHFSWYLSSLYYYSAGRRGPRTIGGLYTGFFEAEIWTFLITIFIFFYKVLSKILTLQYFKGKKSILVCYLLTVYLVLTADLVGSNGRSCQNFFCSKNMQIVWTEDDH